MTITAEMDGSMENNDNQIARIEKPPPKTVWPFFLVLWKMKKGFKNKQKFLELICKVIKRWVWRFYSFHLHIKLDYRNQICVSALWLSYIGRITTCEWTFCSHCFLTTSSFTEIKYHVNCKVYFSTKVS